MSKRRPANLKDATHYWLDTTNPKRHYCIAFVMEECESCGEPVAAPNPVKFRLTEDEGNVTPIETEAMLREWGIPRLLAYPSEGYYDEEAQMGCCDACAK
jgi:hypothetical protein